MNPIALGANRLRVISGYATSAMAFHHLERIRTKGCDVAIELIVGMAPQDGLSLTNHKGFQKLTADEDRAFTCSYIYRPPTVHSKVYVWLRDEEPLRAFAGSANYTQTAFETQREVLVPCDARLAQEYFDHLSPESIFCDHIDAENVVQIYNDRELLRSRPADVTPEEEENLQTVSGIDNIASLPRVCVTFLANDGTLPLGSGLNWGQRDGREPNQAYIRLPSTVYRTDFFPPVATHFTVLTDDNKVLICTRAQDNGKAIHTPHNNSEIGIYFRQRLRVRLGQPVLKEHLDRYGRNDVCFFKIDDETYFMDFSNGR